MDLSLNLFVYTAAAVLGSTVLSTFVTKWFDRFKSSAEAEHKKAEATDVLQQAWERSMNHLTSQLELQAKQIYDLRNKVDEAYKMIDELRIENARLEVLLANRRKDDPK